MSQRERIYEPKSSSLFLSFRPYSWPGIAMVTKNSFKNEGGEGIYIALKKLTTLFIHGYMVCIWEVLTSASLVQRTI